MRPVARAGLLGTALLLSLAGVTAAKGGAVATLDAPIPPAAEPGSKIDVGWSAGWPNGAGGLDPIIGSPVFIRLTSVDGSERIEASGTERPSGSGHYVASITVPRGGVSLVEIGLRGESCVNGECIRSDIPFVLSDADRLPQLGAPRAPAPLVQAPEPVVAYNDQPLAAPPSTSRSHFDGGPLALAAVALAGLGALAFVVRRRRPLAGRV
jgi:MYXO-CTERM domain-containing protein